MTKTLNLSLEIEAQLSQVSQQTGLKEDELILEAILSYLEDFADIKEAQERLINPPDRYLTLEEVEKELGLAD
jgi:RHH-type rel operon transcriptional repressor/antitoxin RelB